MTDRRLKYLSCLNCKGCYQKRVEDSGDIYPITCHGCNYSNARESENKTLRVFVQPRIARNPILQSTFLSLKSPFNICRTQKTLHHSRNSEQSALFLYHTELPGSRQNKFPSSGHSSSHQWSWLFSSAE